jgi:hypothetical protein
MDKFIVAFQAEIGHSFLALDDIPAIHFPVGEIAFAVSDFRGEEGDMEIGSVKGGGFHPFAVDSVVAGVKIAEFIAGAEDVFPRIVVDQAVLLDKQGLQVHNGIVPAVILHHDYPDFIAGVVDAELIMDHGEVDFLVFAPEGVGGGPAHPSLDGHQRLGDVKTARQHLLFPVILLVNQ